MNDMNPVCTHCVGAGEDRLWSGPLYRLVLVHEPGFAGWSRLIWNEHVAEVTDVPAEQRKPLFDGLIALEQALREELQPKKINIASLGTAAPHLHFHVIPRFADDPTFPEPVWLPRVRSSERKLPEDFAARMRERLAGALGPSQPLVSSR